MLLFLPEFKFVFVVKGLAQNILEHEAVIPSTILGLDHHHW